MYHLHKRSNLSESVAGDSRTVRDPEVGSLVRSVTHELAETRSSMALVTAYDK